MYDFAVSTYEQIRTTVALAHEALSELEGELDRLGQRVDHLRAFVRVGDALLETSCAAEVSADMVLCGSMTAAQKAQMVLAEVGVPMTVDGMMESLEARDLVEGQQREALRTALRTRTDVFTRCTRGVYGLVAWTTTHGA